jgi:acetyl esterase/lipase
MLRVCVLLAVGLSAASVCWAQKPPQPTRKQVYKTIGDVQLQMHIFEPKGHRVADRRSAIVFFFGGGWVGGRPSQFYPHAAHLAEHGMLAMCAEYRVRKTHGTTPFECVQDGKSAIRWVRKHAAQLGVDADRIAAGGGSAGGHVAAATATVPGLDQRGEDLSVSAKPEALVLFNPVYDNGPDGYGYDRVKPRYREISPLHNIDEKTPPAIVFLGTRDKLIPVSTAKEFQARMCGVGVRSELILFADQPHGFFNFGRGDGSHYRKTVAAMDGFLRSLKYLPPAAANPSR